MSNTSSKATSKPVKVGITGGIGSGKSTVCQIFRILNIPVFEADTEAKILMENDPAVREALTSLMGPGLYAPAGKLNRSWMAERIFNDKSLLEKVNGIVHPAVRGHFSSWYAGQSSPYIIQEAAILFESGAYQLMDLNITVTAPEELRIQRVMARDGVQYEKVKSRMEHQWPEEKKVGLSDFLIHNDESEFLVVQVLKIHQKLLNYGKVC